MPYSVAKHGSCPVSKPHAVVKEDGSVAPGGCHSTREGALAHQRALMANVSDAAAARTGMRVDHRVVNQWISSRTI